MAKRTFPNSYARPDGTLSATYNPGDGVLHITPPCPAGVLAVGPEFSCKVGSTLYLVTSLGAGSIVWAVPGGPQELTTDAIHTSGTGVYLEPFTQAAIETIRDPDFVTVTDQTGKGFPNSVTFGSLGTASHNHTTAAGDGGVLTNDEHDGYSEYGAIGVPGAPASGFVRLYGRVVGGISGIYAKGDDGVEVGPLGTGGSVDLAGLTDVSIPTPNDGDLLQYKSGPAKWEAADPMALGHYEVVMSGSGPPPDPITTFDGTDWVYGWVPGP